MLKIPKILGFKVFMLLFIYKNVFKSIRKNSTITRQDQNVHLVVRYLHDRRGIILRIENAHLRDSCLTVYAKKNVSI